MAQLRSKAAAAEDVLPSLEDMIPFNDVQSELHRMVNELTWPAVQLSFFRRCGSWHRVVSAPPPAGEGQRRGADPLAAQARGRSGGAGEPNAV
jgi:hypothetical protein